MKKRILFVDDRMKHRAELAAALSEIVPDWDFVFCDNGIESLKLLSASAFDAVIAELDLPLRDGAQLLSEVMDRHPGVLRFVLSDLTNKSAVMKCVGTAHRFLAKPCGAKSLITALDRAFSLDVWLPNKSVSALLAQMPKLPSPPSLYFEVVQELQSPAGSLDHVGRMVSRDPAMTAKILQLVNSAMFGLNRTLANPSEAIFFLGAETTKSLLLLAHTYSYFERFDRLGFSVDRFWQHAITTGHFARWIAEAESAPSTLVEEARTAGMLHDIGKLALVTNLPERYRQVIQMAEARKIEAWEAEQEVFGATHAEVGACLLGIWGLSIPIVEALALHHLPLSLITPGFSPLTAVHAANAIDHALSQSLADLRVDRAYLAQIDLADRPTVWRELCRARQQSQQDS